MKELSGARPSVKSVFSGAGGRGMMYEMRLYRLGLEYSYARILAIGRYFLAGNTKPADRGIVLTTPCFDSP